MTSWGAGKGRPYSHRRRPPLSPVEVTADLRRVTHSPDTGSELKVAALRWPPSVVVSSCAGRGIPGAQAVTPMVRQ